MSFNSQFLATALVVGFVSPLGAYTLGTGYQSSVLASTVTAYDYTQFEGISKSGDTLYVGNFRSVKQYNLSSGTYSDYGTVPGNNGISHVTYAGGKVYASAFTSYSAPYPYTMYSVGAGDNTSSVLTMGGIYDAAVSPAGQFYFVANPDVDADDEGDGSRLYRMDLADNSLTEVAYFGGASGGIAFDASGNLFYAHYDNGVIYSFSASDLLVGSRLHRLRRGREPRGQPPRHGHLRDHDLALRSGQRRADQRHFYRHGRRVPLRRGHDLCELTELGLYGRLRQRAARPQPGTRALGLRAGLRCPGRARPAASPPAWLRDPDSRHPMVFPPSSPSGLLFLSWAKRLTPSR
jgi:hypothetical protein